MEKMKIAVLGGSFNPIHTGHLVLADEVCKSFGYGKILFIPTANPPHKEMNCAVSGIQRLEMVQAACSLDDRFEAEDCEVKRGGISYTYDTICYLEEKYKDVLEGKIGLIMGSDLIENFYRWYKAPLLARKCDLILAKRLSVDEVSDYSNKPAGHFTKQTELELDCRFKEENKGLFDNALLLDNPVLPVSSGMIRKAAAENKAFKYLVPSPVFSYIINGKLYGYRQS